MSTTVLQSPAANPPATPFIFVTSANAKPDAALRRSIRSHVMRGKNRKRPSGRVGVQISSWINSTPTASLDQSVNPSPDSIPRSMGSDLRFFAFAEELTPAMLDLVYQFFTVIKQTAFPGEFCVDLDMTQFVGYFATDAIFLYSTLFTTQGFFDVIRHGEFGSETMRYLGLTLELLRNRLADSEAQISNATIAAVISLCLMSDRFGDVESAGKHMQGLCDIVQLRGGIQSFQNNPQLQVKICRADLGFALSSGSRPRFFQQGIAWNPYVATPNHAKTTPIHKLHPRTPDQRLVNVWLDLQEFSRSANLAFQTGRKMRGELFQEALISAQYRLLALEAENLHYSLVERMAGMGMLAFSSVTFLQVQGLPMHMDNFATKLRHLLHSLAGSSSHPIQSPTTTEKDEREPGWSTPPSGNTEVFLKVKLWLLFMAYISVLDQPKDQEFVSSCVSETMNALGLLTWPAVRDVLMTHMWVDWTHKRRGETLVESILAKQTKHDVCKHGGV